MHEQVIICARMVQRGSRSPPRPCALRNIVFPTIDKGAFLNFFLLFATWVKTTAPRHTERYGQERQEEKPG